MGPSKQQPTVTDAVKTKSALKKGGTFVQPFIQAEPYYTHIENIHKAQLKAIDVKDLPKEKPDFQMPGVSKDGLIAEWLIGFIQAGLKSKKLTQQNLLPKKADIANYLGVSIGTVQNAIRIVEDQGFVASKQRIGTVISQPETQNNRVRKLTSKRDVAVKAIKQLVVQRSIQVGEALPSAREVAKLIGSAPNTTRLALEYLASEGIVDDKGHRGNKANWYLREIPILDKNDTVQSITSETLIDQIEADLKALIETEFQVGDKLPSHLELAERLKVSIKTVHDAMGRITEQGVVQSLRGRYGTYVLRKPTQTGSGIAATSKEAVGGNAIPAFFTDALQYNYERVTAHLSNLISAQFKVGDKLPAMNELADALNVSSNTIRKALLTLSSEGYLRFERGRYGGTFVVKLPKASKADAKKQASNSWVSVNPKTKASYSKKGSLV